VSSGTQIPAVSSVLTEEQIGFCVELVEASGVASSLEALLERRTGRPRTLSVLALLVGLMLLATDDRPLHLKAVTKLLYRCLPEHWRQRLGVVGDAATPRAFGARYRCVLYLFHLCLSVLDPSPLKKNRVIGEQELAGMRKQLSDAEMALRHKRLQSVLDDLLDATVRLCSDEELARFDGSVGLDATPVPLYARGPSKRTRRCSSDPDGGWYVREGDHREASGPDGKTFRKLSWALEETIVTMGRGPGITASHPNLILGIGLGRPGEDPGGMGTRLLSRVRSRGYPAGYLGADRGYTQTLPERFHLPVRSLGYSLVMDYKTTELGRQAESGGAVMTDGCFYCPAMPETLVDASAAHRSGKIDRQLFSSLVAARQPWRLKRKEGPDGDGFERYSCPATAKNPKLCCPLRPETATKALGEIPVLSPPLIPPAICCQGSITIAPDIGARHRQDLAFGSEIWHDTYASYRNTIEGANGYLKDTAHQALANPDRRRVRGIAAQSLFCGLLAAAANVRKIAAFRQMQRDGTAATAAERAKRRRVSLKEFNPLL